MEIYQWTEGDFVVEEPIKGHTRQVKPRSVTKAVFKQACCSPCHHLVTMQHFQVSDLHWNTREPPLLASSSLDGNIHVWDLRWSSMSPNCGTRRYEQGSTEADPVLPDDSGSLPHKVEPRGLHLPCKVLDLRSSVVFYLTAQRLHS